MNRNIIDLAAYAPQLRRTGRRVRRHLMREICNAVEALVTLSIGVCCVICLVLVFTML